MEVLTELVVVIAAATLGGALFGRAGLPAIPAFLIAGAIVGPGGLGLAGSRADLSVVAELGVVFLLFEIGLELPLDTVRRFWRDAVLAGGLQMIATIGGVTALGVALGLPLPQASALGGLIALSSTAVVMSTLEGRHQTETPYGRLALAILIFQDLCIVPMLLGIPILAGAIEPSVAAIGGALVTTATALGVLFVGARFAFPWLLDRVAVLRSRDLFSLVAFLLVVGSAVGAEELGLTHSVGAFCAGIVLAASPYAHQLQAEVAPLRGVLLGVFFTSIGMLVEPVAALHLAPQIGIYVGVVFLLKAGVIAAVIGLATRHGARLGVVVGIALAQTGEFSFVLAAQVRAVGLLGEELWQVFLTGSIVTLAATPLLIAVAPSLLRRLGEGAHSVVPDDLSALRDHVVIAGFGHAGRTVARALRSAEVPYVVIELNPLGAAEAIAAGEPMVYGDVTRTRILDGLHLARARTLVVAISDPVAVRRLTSLARGIAPELPIVVRAQHVAEVDELYARGASRVVAAEYESALHLMVAVLRGVGIAAEAADRVADTLREEGYEAMRGRVPLLLDPWLADVLREVASQWIEVPEGAAAGRTIGELAIRARTGVSILALRRGDRVHPAPGADERLEAGDALLAVADADQAQRLRAVLDDPEASI